jgi:Cd2+/Zn2+-exporting ATPase
MDTVVGKLHELGFSEYEAKAYLGLLAKSLVTGYELAKLCGVPRSMIYEVLGKLTTRGAVLTSQVDDTTRYAPVPPHELLDRLRHEHEDLLDVLSTELSRRAPASEPDYVWNIEGATHILAKSREMIDGAQRELLLALTDESLAHLREPLRRAHDRGLRLRLLLFGQGELDFGQVERHPFAEAILSEIGEGGLMVVADGREALIGNEAGKAAWTGNRHLVFIVSRYITQEMYEQRLLDRLGVSTMLEIFDPDDRAILERLSRRSS